MMYHYFSILVASSVILSINNHLILTGGKSGYSQEEGPLRDALRFANACGALTVMERGAIPALPSREAVLKALMESVA